MTGQRDSDRKLARPICTEKKPSSIKWQYGKQMTPLTDITLPVAKCLIVGDADQLIPVESELCIRLQGKINVFRSEPHFLELVPQELIKPCLSLSCWKRQEYHGKKS